MKSCIYLLTLVLSFIVFHANAGSEIIKSNGKIGGESSCRIVSSSGNSFIIYRMSGSWYRGGIGHMGNKYYNWTKEKVSNFLCGR